MYLRRSVKHEVKVTCSKSIKELEVEEICGEIMKWTVD